MVTFPYNPVPPSVVLKLVCICAVQLFNLRAVLGASSFSPSQASLTPAPGLSTPASGPLQPSASPSLGGPSSAVSSISSWVDARSSSTQISSLISDTPIVSSSLTSSSPASSSSSFSSSLSSSGISSTPSIPASRNATTPRFGNSTSISAPRPSQSARPTGNLDFDDDDFAYKPPALAAEEVAAYNAIEASYYAYHVSQDPIAGSNPKPLPPCSSNSTSAIVKRSLLGDWFKKVFPDPPARPDLRQKICAVQQVVSNVYFHHVSRNSAAADGVTAQSISNTMALLNGVYAWYGIQLNYQPPLIEIVDASIPDPFDIGDTSSRAYNLIRSSRIGSMQDLNIWLTGDIPDANGFARFPWYNSPTDGIFVERQHLVGAGGNDGQTFIHEIGHWLGLNHTHAQSTSDKVESVGWTCAAIEHNSEKSIAVYLDDGLSDTFLTPSPDTLADRSACVQPVCYAGSGANPQQYFINNWMSYSRCRGTRSETDTTLSSAAFSPQQRARMFSAYTFWRYPKTQVDTSGCPDVRTVDTSRLNGRRAAAAAKRADAGNAVSFDIGGVEGSLSSASSLCVADPRFAERPPTYNPGDGYVVRPGGPGSTEGLGGKSSGAVPLLSGMKLCLVLAVATAVFFTL